MQPSGLLHPLFYQLQLYFKSLGLKVNSNLTLIEASDNTYTLWVNWLKLNLFAIVTIKLAEALKLKV
jgi:hypothetical protein